MARTKRPWGVWAGPVIFVVGLAGFWGVKTAMGMKDRVEDWGYQLEHSSEAVAMEMPRVPLIPPLYVNSERIGRIEVVVIDRDRPRAVDSGRVIATVDKEHLHHLENCSLRLRVSSWDPEGLKRALRCTRDTEGLLSFGSLEISGMDMTVPILVRRGDLPCDQSDVHVGACGEMTHELNQELHQLRGELQRELRRFRVEVRDAAREARSAVRATIR